jgi:hypothetical protein
MQYRVEYQTQDKQMHSQDFKSKNDILAWRELCSDFLYDGDINDLYEHASADGIDIKDMDDLSEWCKENLLNMLDTEIDSWFSIIGIQNLDTGEIVFESFNGDGE